MSDFFGGDEPARPSVRPDEATGLVLQHYGIAAQVRELGSNQDRNYLVAPDAPATDRVLFKVDNAMFADDELAAQDLALERLAGEGLHVPRPIRGLDGRVRQHITVSGGEYRARMLTFVEGVPLSRGGAPHPIALEALGRLSAEIAVALAPLEHPGLARTLQWDLRNAMAVVESLAAHVADDALRARVLDAAREAWVALAPLVDDLPVQAIHGDITGDNVVGTWDGGVLLPTGVIDFGDLGHGWRVAELAVTVTGAFMLSRGDIVAAIPTIEGFLSIVTLTPEERTALWPLVVLRAAVLVVSGHYQATLDQGNAYVLERLDEERLAFDAACSVPVHVGAAIVEAVAAPPTVDGGAVVLARMTSAAGEPVVVDLGPASPAMDDGAWLGGEETESRLLLEATSDGALAVIPHGTVRLTRAPELAAQAPAVIATGDELVSRSRIELVAPAAAIVSAVETGTVTLQPTDGAIGPTIRIEGVVSAVAVGSRVGAGDPIASTREAGPDGMHRARIHRLVVADVTPPRFIGAPWARAWARLMNDPASLTGREPAATATSATAEQSRRDAVFASAQERYYVRPPVMQRGWRSVMIDDHGRCFLDMVNNVTGIGHAHPRLTEAVSRQLATLNTNSRFLYPQLAEFSERLLEHSPDPALDTVLLVNSGTEAVDLALRLAMLHTGRRDILSLREGYHGWSFASDAISTSAFDNPNALGSRPDWVHIADIPNPYRGTHRGPDAAAGYLADLGRRLDELTEAGTPPAAYIAEPVIGNSGGIVPPEGYVAGAYALARAHGALAIADEVQVGYGRLGSHFWGSTSHGAIPDIITTAKAAGNAMPIGAVVTRREIADSLGREGNFFSSAGGSPVSCVAGIAVLDVMRDEDLQHNALEVGGWLAEALRGLADRHSIIGAVHGGGLYLGVELVRDRDTLEPAVAETAAICERLLERGVIMQATSERQNVLKIKPPLVLTRDQAEFFVDQLDAVLSELASD
jgi:4-aminobutyrate aminotransferase-like enzyme/Ser/Thr protein kinase RdoA (MazF antagonist)